MTSLLKWKVFIQEISNPFINISLDGEADRKWGKGKVILIRLSGTMGNFKIGSGAIGTMTIRISTIFEGTITGKVVNEEEYNKILERLRNLLK